MQNISITRTTSPTTGIARPTNAPRLRVKIIFKFATLFKFKVGRILYLILCGKGLRETTEATDVPFVAPANFPRVDKNGYPTIAPSKATISSTPNCCCASSRKLRKTVPMALSPGEFQNCMYWCHSFEILIVY